MTMMSYVTMNDCPLDYPTYLRCKFSDSNASRSGEKAAVGSYVITSH